MAAGVWSPQGWLSIGIGGYPFLDFAGSSCVHLVTVPTTHCGAERGVRLGGGRGLLARTGWDLGTSLGHHARVLSILI